MIKATNKNKQIEFAKLLERRVRNFFARLVAIVFQDAFILSTNKGWQFFSLVLTI
jgi:hypothetical protein